MPWERAFLSAGTTAFGSLAEMTIAFWRCEVSVLMYDTCDEALASDGPTRLNTPFTELTASSPPLSDTVKYGLLICLGRKAILRPSLIGALGSAFDDAFELLEPLELDSLELSFVEPQADTPSRL